MLTYLDLLGSGVQETSDSILIPKSNLTEVGLSSFEYPDKILAAIFLRAIGYFESILIDVDGSYFVDAIDGSKLAYKNTSDTLNVNYSGVEIPNNQLIHEYHFNFYQEL
jgi:hypothetical protein